jgi:hypothetical protein
MYWRHAMEFKPRALNPLQPTSIERQSASIKLPVVIGAKEDEVRWVIDLIQRGV